MKNVIVTIAEIFLGVVLFALIFGSSNSIRTKAESIFTQTITELNEVAP